MALFVWRPAWLLACPACCCPAPAALGAAAAAGCRCPAELPPPPRPAAVPILELAAYAGYAFVAACASLAVQLATGARAAAPGEGGVVHACSQLCMLRTALRVSLLIWQLSTPAFPLVAAGSGAAYHAVWAYGSLCCAVFLVRPASCPAPHSELAR